MSGESATVAALRRASKRAIFHLLRAGVEGLKAIEAVVDELAQVRSNSEVLEPEQVARIEVE